jgi:dolichyl-phosphate-mannose-protein mannosyltransferase
MIRHEARLRLALLLLATGMFYLPAVAGGYMTDDLFHLMAFEQLPETFTRELNVFSLVSSSEQVTLFKRFGIVPWWTSDGMRIDFWRPLASLTHFVDYQLFGRNPEAAHLVSIAWYILVVFLVHRLLARFFPRQPRVLLLATAIFAFDDGHVIDVQWIANRNEIIAAVFVLLSFLAYLRLREGRSRHGGALSVLCFGTALLAKESSAVLPLLVASHALVYPEDPSARGIGRLRARLHLHLALLALLVVFMVLYFAGGHGAATAYYTSPLVSPWRWLLETVRSAPYHLAILVTGVPVHALGSTPVADHPVVAGVVALVSLGFVALAWRWLRPSRDAAFFVLWMVVQQPLVATCFPDPRRLFLPSIGFAFLVAAMCSKAWHRRRELLPRTALGAMAVLHLVVAPALVQVTIQVVNRFQRSYDDLASALDDGIDYQHLPEAGLDVFLLNFQQREVSAMFGLYLRDRLPAPGVDYAALQADHDLDYEGKLRRGLGADRVHYHALSFVPEDVDVTIVSDREIVLAPRGGRFFTTLFDWLYTTGEPFVVGQSFDTGVFVATIDAVDDGEVSRVRFRFREPLSSPRYRFFAFDGERFVPFDTSSVGVPLADGPRREDGIIR